jgi:hypothetical protein
MNQDYSSRDIKKKMLKRLNACRSGYGMTLLKFYMEMGRRKPQRNEAFLNGYFSFLL